MNHLMTVDNLWAWLIQDVSLIGGFHTPLLSWFGAAGIVVVFLWYSGFLLLAVRRMRAGCGRIEPQLSRLVRERQQAGGEWLVIPALVKKTAGGAHVPGARRDLDDLEELDRIMRSDQAFADEWLSFRKTLTVEQSAWFLEPTVHAGLPASEFFSFDTLCINQLNMRFYQHLPSVMTGMGLLLTFLAILIGLSKLHANGTQIEGLQGLVNGLAGKFVTSIVGLACANAFLIMEKAVWHRVAQRHRRIVALLNQVFPQHARDSGNQSATMTAENLVGISSRAGDLASNRLAESVQQRLSSAVDALHGIARSLEREKKTNAHPEREQLAVVVGGEVRTALAPLIDPLHHAIEDLSRALRTSQTDPTFSSDAMDRLVNRLTQQLRTDRSVTAASDAPLIGWRLPWAHKRGADEMGS